MAGLRSGKDTSGIKKNTSARKTPEDSEIAAQRKRTKDKREEREKELESIRKDLQAAESQLKDSQLTEAERAQLQEKNSRLKRDLQDIEAEIQQADQDLMDIDTEKAASEESNGQAPAKSKPWSVQSQAKPQKTATEHGKETPVKQEPVDGFKEHAHGRSATPSPPETMAKSVEKGRSRTDVDLDPDGDDDDELLVGMSKLSTVEYSDGEADAWFKVRNAEKLIVRYGPKRAAKYVIQSGKGYNTDGLQRVSDPESRICSIMDRDDMGEKRRRYSLKNIKGVVGVAVMERSPDSTSSRAPTTYVKIKWINIAQEDQHLCTNGNNWITRTDLIHMTNEELADSKIKEAWEKQEIRYNNWERGQDIGTPGRSPTPFPLDIFQWQKRERSSPEKGKPGITVKREEAPLVSMEASAAMATPSPDTPIKSPRKSDESEVGSRGTTLTPEGQNGTVKVSDIGENNLVSHTTFSQKEYKENMKRDMDLDAMRKEDMKQYVRALALIEAEYATYKGYMLSHGAIEIA